MLGTMSLVLMATPLVRLVTVREPRGTEPEVAVVYVRGKSTGLRVSGATTPELSDFYQNRRGDLLFTVEAGRTDIGWSPILFTYLTRRGRTRLYSEEWRAAGLSPSGDLLLTQETGSYLEPSNNPYGSLRIGRVVFRGHSYDLGPIADAHFTSRGAVVGYFIVDGKGRPGNGVPGLVNRWYRQDFEWRQGKRRLTTRTPVKSSVTRS
jgi:hypothetical protein